MPSLVKVSRTITWQHGGAVYSQKTADALHTAVLYQQSTVTAADSAGVAVVAAHLTICQVQFIESNIGFQCLSQCHSPFIPHRTVSQAEAVYAVVAAQ